MLEKWLEQQSSGVIRSTKTKFELRNKQGKLEWSNEYDNITEWAK